MTPADLANCRNSLARIVLLSRMVPVPTDVAEQRTTDANNLRIALDALAQPAEIAAPTPDPETDAD